MLKPLIKVAVIVILGISTARALECHTCRTFDDLACRDIETYKTKFLEKCSDINPQCVLLKKKTGKRQSIIRKCVAQDYTCPDEYDCNQCTKDGCNSRNEIKFKPIEDDDSTLPDPEGSVFQANTAQICTSVSLLIVVLVWCVLLIIYRRRKNSEYEEEDGYEYEEEAESEEYYEYKA